MPAKDYAIAAMVQHNELDVLWVAQVDLCIKFFPGILIAPVIQGTIAGFAGKPCLDCVRGALGIQQGHESNEIMHPGYVWRSAMFCTVLYYWAVHWVGLLKQTEGLALLRLILVRYFICCQALWTPLIIEIVYAIY